MNELDINLSIFHSISESAQSINRKSTSTFADMATNLGKKEKDIWLINYSIKTEELKKHRLQLLTCLL